MGDTPWTAIFDAKIWRDDSRVPEKNTTITSDVHIKGGEPARRIPATHVIVRVDGRPPFTIGLLRGQEWRQFQRMMDDFYELVGWTTYLDGEIWNSPDRAPRENQEIQVHLHLDAGREVETIQVFAIFPNQPMQTIDLQVGREWAHFCEFMKGFVGENRWTASFDGKR
jgi:hypothetical protein